MASSGGEEIPLQRAWSTVHMDIRNLDHKIDTKDISQSNLAYKIQFALFDEKMKKSLPLRLQTKGISMKVQENGEESVLVELQMQLQANEANEVIDIVENALEDLTVKEVIFENEQKLQQALNSLENNWRDFLSNGFVRLFLVYLADVVKVNMIGLEIDVTALEEIFKVEDTGKIIKAPILETEEPEIFYDKAKKVYVAPHIYDVDTIQYLHLLNFKQQFSKHCKYVKCVERDDKKTEFQIEGRLKHDVVEANKYLTKFVNSIVRKRISVSSAAFEFLKTESITLHFKEKLRKCPAHIQVSNEVVVWAPTQERFESAEKLLLNTIKEQIITGKVEITMEIKEIISNSKEKIQLLDSTDDESVENNKTFYQVVYLEEMSSEVQRIVDCLKSNVKAKGVEKIAHYEEHVIKYFMASRLEREVKKPLPSIKVKYKIQSKSVTFSSEIKSDVEDAKKEFDAYSKKVQKVELRDLPEGMKDLLLRQHISEYVANTFKCHYLLFMQEEDGKFVCVGQYLGDGKKLVERVKKCILSTSIRKDFLQMEYGRDLLDKFADRIFQENDSRKNISHIYHTADLQNEIDSLVEKCTMRDYYRKKCNPATAEFLQIPNLSIVSKVEEKYNMKICFEIGHIVFYGDYSLGEQASKELEKSIPHDEVILRNGDRYKSILESEEGRKTMNEISKGKNCCWTMTCQTDGKAGKLDKIMMNGINHFVSWVPSGGNSTISLVEADFTKAEFDVLVIPVDDKLCGESLLKRDKNLEDYGSLLDKVVTKSLPFGVCEYFENCKVFSCKTLVLIPSYRVCTSNQKQSPEIMTAKKFKKMILEVCSNAFLKNQRKIGFAVPTFSARFFKDVASGFSSAVTSSTENKEEAYLYICTQEEAESVIEDFDKEISEVLGTKRTRRMVTSAYKGLFNKPATSVKVVKKSIFDVKTECLVVLTSKDLNLEKGNLSKKVLKEGGPDLAKEIRNKYKGTTLENGTFISTSPGNLKHKGVKRLIFGHLPKWYNHTVRLKVLQQFVEGCLIEADEQDCKSIAFPALGTGNLEYPPRDVAAAMLDGIESYTEESMIAKLKTVYITTTDDAMFQILGMEQKNRGDQNTRGDGDIANDAEILTSNDNRINYTVVMERHLQTNPSGKFVKVKFLPKMEAGSMNCPTQWLLLIGCGTTQKDLEKAVLEMVNHCEKMLITSVHVYCSKELPLSFGVQSVAIIDTVYNMPTDKYPSRVYKYLSNVTIVAGDKDGFSNIESRLLQQKSLLASFFGASREWRKESQSRPESSIKIKLVGEQMEDVNAVKKAIEDFISKSEWQLPNVAKQVKVQKEIEHSSEEQTEIVNKTKSFGQTKAVSQTGNVGQTKAVNQAGAVSQTNINSNTGAVQQNGAITEHEGTEKQQEHMESSEVSAELNQGIVDHLLKESFRKFYHTWKIQVEDVYSVKITENRGDGKLQMNVSGSFESILRFEEYLEENFPNLPKESLSEEMEYDDSHFKISDEEVTMQIPITKDEKTKLMMFYAEEIKHLTDKGFLSQLLTTSENTITLICKKDKEAYVKDRFYSFKEKVSQLQVKEIHFASLEVMKKVETLCLNKQTDSSIRYANDEKEMQIEIMGLDPKALDDLFKNVERVEAEVYEEYYSEKKTFYFDKVSVHIYRSDILKTDVDCIVSSGGRVEKCIDDVAGKTYAGKFEKWFKGLSLQLSECYTTGSGNLKRFKKVIHVNCSLLAGDYPDYQGLYHIQESVENCLLEADKQGMKSVAFPFICSAESGYGIDECAQQYIRAILVSGQKLKSVMEVHFVDKDSVGEVCKVFDGYFNMRKDNDKDLLVYGENIKYEIRNTAIKLCSGDIQLSIAHGIAIFVDKHLPLPSDNRLLNNLQEMEKTDFQKMMKRVREKDEIVTVKSKCRMMYDVVLAACPDMKEEKKSKKCLHDTVVKLLRKASDFGFISFAISLPETNKDGRITRPGIQEFCKALVDFLKSNKTSLKDVKIVGTCDKNMEAVSNALEFCRKERVLHGGSFYGTLV